jgi:hypothetical protein
MSGRNVIDFLDYQRTRDVGTASAISGRCCRHCGASLDDDESEDDCSSAGISISIVERPSRAWAPCTS